MQKYFHVQLRLNSPYVSVLKALLTLFRECVIYLSFLPSKITVRYANGMSSTGPFFSVHLDIFLVSAERCLLLNVHSLELVPVMNSVTKGVSKCRATFLFAALFFKHFKTFLQLYCFQWQKKLFSINCSISLAVDLHWLCAASV